MSVPPPTKIVVDCTTGETVELPLTPEEIAHQQQIAAQQSRAASTAAFAEHEDAERLSVIRERAETDPAFAALADLALGRQGV